MGAFRGTTEVLNMKRGYTFLLRQIISIKKGKGLSSGSFQFCKCTKGYFLRNLKYRNITSTTSTISII